MTDMRATERLLEVLEQSIAGLVEAGDITFTGPKLVDIVQELRRRGDTLVRAADLRKILEETNLGGDGPYLDALDRLENAIGGKP